ncbi:MAG TPA: hypothetical protein VLE99_04905 [Candidatus Saccharimonadales bacterium]|nr:hypothetical protein [Candidatus Saccharimonadales bacterium]
MLVLAGAGAYWWVKQQTTPDKVFHAAITKLLSTTSITQSVGDANNMGVVSYNLSNLKDPHVSVSLSIKAPGETIKLSGYGTLQNDYVKYNSFGDPTSDRALSGIVNKWVQMRTNGTLATGADPSIEDLTSPRYLAFGDIMIGNFSAAQRQQILQFIQTNNIYSYNAKKVTTATVNGKKVYVYPITENIAKLKELNKKVAPMMGLSTSDIQDVLDTLGTSGNPKLYITVGSKEIVKYTLQESGATATGSYTDYGSTTLPSEPTGAMSWTEFEQKQAAISNQLLGSDTSGSSGLTSGAQSI